MINNLDLLISSSPRLLSHLTPLRPPHAGVLPPGCSGVNVFVRDEKKYSVLFQSVVLPCQYNSVSTQTPVVQWVYKSYCRDRTRDSFNFPDSLGKGQAGGGPTGGARGAGGGYETGMTANYLDCADSSRTVRTVASMSGSSITLSEYYKSRDISITNSKTRCSLWIDLEFLFPFKSHFICAKGRILAHQLQMEIDFVCGLHRLLREFF